MTDKIVVLSSCGSAEEAETIARKLVETGVAACVNILPAVRSIYRWQGQIENAQECMLLIKSTRAKFEGLSAELQNVHSYQVPEIIAVQLVAGSQAYLDWIDREVSQTSPDAD